MTNPAIDRGREGEVFSTSSLFGATTSIGQAPLSSDIIVALKIPLLTGGYPGLGDSQQLQELAEESGSFSIEQLLEIFNGNTTWMVLGVLNEETVAEALQRLADQAVTAVKSGSQCLMLDDFETHREDVGWLDPMLAVSCIDAALRAKAKQEHSNLRRRAGLVLRSAAVRSLHDIVLLSGFGVDAINPYAMFAAAIRKRGQGIFWTGSAACWKASRQALKKLYQPWDAMNCAVMAEFAAPSGWLPALQKYCKRRIILEVKPPA